MLEYRSPEEIIDAGGKSNKEHIANILEIQKNVNYKQDFELRSSVLDRFFPHLKTQYSEFVKFRPKLSTNVEATTAPFQMLPVDPMLGETSVTTASPTPVSSEFNIADVQFENDYETDLENFYGKDKYNLYKLYEKNGTLEPEDIPESLKDDFNKVVQQEAGIRKASRTDVYTDNNATGFDFLANDKFWTGRVKEVVPDDLKAEATATSHEMLFSSTDDFTQAYLKNVSQTNVVPVDVNGPVISKTAKKMDAYMQAFSDHTQDKLDEYFNALKLNNINVEDQEELQAFYNNLEIPYSQRKEVLDKQIEAIEVAQAFQKQAEIYGDASGMLASLDKNYSGTYRALLSLENILYETINLGFYAGELAEGALLGGPQNTIGNYRKSHISSKLAFLEQKREDQIPMTGKLADMSWNNFGSTISNMLADNVFSISAAFTYQGLVKKGFGKAAKKALTATWFTVEGAGKLNRMELLQADSKKNIASLEKLRDAAITPSNKLLYQKELEKQYKYRDYSNSQKLISLVLYGGIASYAERIGTMAWVDDMIRTSRTLGVKNIKDGIRKGGKFLWMGPGTEVIEESVTLLGHNAVDNIVLAEDKSLIEGMDGDFFANVILTSLAIAGPQSYNNMRNIYRGHITKKEDKQKYSDLSKEYIENLYILNEGTNLSTREGIRLSDRAVLEQRNMEILKELAEFDIEIFGSLSDLSSKEVEEVFNIARKQQQVLRSFTEIGASGQNGKYVQREKANLQKQYDNLQAEKEKLLQTSGDKMRQRFEKFYGSKNVPTKVYEDYGRYTYFNTIVKGLQKDQSKFKKVKSKEDLEKILNEAVQNGTISEAFKQEVLSSYDDTETTYGANGTYLPDGTILVFDENVMKNLTSSSELDREDAIQVAIHEFGHIYDINNNLVKDGKVVKEAAKVVAGIQAHIEELYNQGRISKKVFNEFKQRVETYKQNNNGQVDLAELLAMIGTMKRANMISTEESSLKYFIKDFMQSYNIYRFGDQGMLLGLETTEDVLRYIDKFNKKVLERQSISVLPPEDQEGVMLSAGAQRTPEKLIRVIKNKNTSPSDLEQANKELLAQYNLLALTAIKFDDRAGDIPRKNVVSAVSIYLPGLIKRFKPGKGKFSTFVTSNIAPKDDTIYEQAKIQAIRDSVKQDDPNVKDLAGDINDTTNTQDTFVQKIDMFEDFSIISTKSSDIKSKIKVKEGQNFKEVIDNNAGQVGEIIFDIAADKIMKGGANLSLVTKYKEGMPLPAEAQSIQRVFNAGENASKYIKTLPLLNVTRKTADINKIGENIDVPRDIYGRAIGIKGLVMDYFYQDYVDPKATSADRAIKQDAETSPGGRSLGLTTQTNVKILKPEFRNPTPQTIEKFKQDLGITPKNQPNIYNRDIGQFLKSNAKALSIGVSLSGAQRKLDQAGAAKTSIAKVTAAQSKAAFSLGSKKVAQSVDAMYMLDGGAIKLTFEGDLDRVDKVLKKFIGEGTHKFKNEKEIRDYFKDFEGIVIKNLPRNMFMGALNSFLKPSKRILPKKGVGEITLEDGRTVTINDFFNEMRADLVKRSKKDYKGKDKVVFGAEFKGEGAKYVYGRTYGSIYGTTAKQVEKSFYDGTREKQNAIFASMHEQFMARVNASIRSNNKNAKIWGNYFSLVGQDTEHPWRMGAEYVLFSKNPKGYDGKLYEWEHAMMATRSYLYLLETSLEEINGEYLDFDRAYKLVMENYKLIALDNYDDKNKLAKSGRQKTMGKNWQFLVNTWLDRYFHPEVAAFLGGIQPKSLQGEGKQTADKIYNVNASGSNAALVTNASKMPMLSRGANKARAYTKDTKPRGMSTFDFDETLIIDGKNFITATGPSGDVIKISSGQWPIKGPKLMDEGYTFDFKDFVNVRGGTEGPLLQKMKNQISKYGPSNVFVLTARMQESDTAIHGWLKSKGIDIPLANITGLGNSTGEAKALWMLEKFSEGYNDMYFVDDALPNVKAVKSVLEQLDIKSKVVQAKINFSAGSKFNQILEEVTGIDAKKRFSAVKGRKRGKGKGKFRFFIPPSHEDFVGLLYNFLGKGEQGNRHRDFFEKTLIRPLNRAFRELNNAKQAIANDFKNLKKLNPEIKKKLNKSIKETKDDYTYGDAVRVYLWNKAGYDIPGLSKSDQDLLVAIVRNDLEMKSFADAVNIISRQENYVKPTEEWEIGDIRTDLIQATDGVNREPFFAEFNNNVQEIFSEENLNKIEAAYGENVREALEDMIFRISSGTRRPTGNNKNVNRFLDYLQASIGGVMFFNMRSSILQQLSVVNFLNFEDNNIFAAAKAFANQKQYWKDWSMIFNSDMLKQRRGGLTMDVNYQDIASYAARSKQPIRAIIKRLLALGFTPTQISDSMAIASGGATFYRNRVNKYLKEGLSQKEAETKAFEDFQIVAESTQQSARPDMTSSQQNSVLGWFILGFQNVTSQYNRIIKKSGSDLINRRISPPYTDQRTSDMANISRILYYGMIQNIVFYTLQTALFAALFNDDDDDEEFLKKRGRVINGTVDSLLRGSGVAGAVVSTIKNAAFAFLSERTKSYNPDESSVLVELLNVSPPMGIKARKVVGGEKTLNYDMKVIQAMKTFDIDNPVWSAATSYTEALTTVPVNRLYKKVLNLREAANRDNTNMQRLFLLFGWSKWNLGIKDPELEMLRQQVKRKKNKRQL